MIDSKLHRYRTHSGVFNTYITKRNAMKNVKDKLHYNYFLEETCKMLTYGRRCVRKGLDMKGYYHTKFS